MTIKRRSRRSRRVSRRISRRVSRRRRTYKRRVSKRRTHRSKRRTHRSKRRTHRSKRRTKRKQKGGAGLAIQGLGTGGTTTEVDWAYMGQLGVEGAVNEARVNWNTYLNAMREKISKSSIYHPRETLHSQREHHDAPPHREKCRECKSLLTRLVSDTQTNEDHFKYDDILFISDVIHANKKHRVFEPSDISFLYDKLSLSTHFIREKEDIKHWRNSWRKRNKFLG